jgi:VWFA-related protein
MKMIALIVAVLFTSHAGLAQAPATPPAAQQSQLELNVVVTDDLGRPVHGLTAQDFTVFDNKAAEEASDFRAVDPAMKQGPPTEIVLVIDAVNSTAQNVVLVEQKVRAFLQRSPRLAEPVCIVLFADTGDRKNFLTVIGPTTDSQGLLSALNEAGPKLPNVGFSGGLGAEDRIPLSLRTMYSVIAQQAKRPGRKAILWISPGWPLMNGEDPKAQQMVFTSIVAFSTEMQQAQVTLYNVDPSGVNNAGGNIFRTNTVSNQMGMPVHESMEANTDSTHLYEAYLKGVSAPKQARFDHLALQVLAIKSGGQLLNQQNDLLKLLDTCVADAESYYLLTVPMAKGKAADEYHDIEVKLHKHGLKAHTISGYYAQP